MSAGANASRQRAPNDQGVYNNFNSYGVNATAAWEVDLWGRVAAKTYAAPTPVRGEQLGGARFVRACATEWYTLAVAVHSEQSDGGAVGEC